MKNKKALIMVDLQNDFCEGGSLAVQGGTQVVQMANNLQRYFDVIVATQDWHPVDHVSFADNHPKRKVGERVIVNNMPQLLWPVHCVQHSRGAKFHADLNLTKIDKIIHKGSDKWIDSYSAFFDNAHERSTGLFEYLQEKKLKEVYVLGLATDYCVKYSSLDAVKLGFDVYVIADACRGVNVEPDDVDEAFETMRKAGVEITCVKSIIAASQ